MTNTVSPTNTWTLTDIGLANFLLMQQKIIQLEANNRMMFETVKSLQRQILMVANQKAIR